MIPPPNVTAEDRMLFQRIEMLVREPGNTFLGNIWTVQGRYEIRIRTNGAVATFASFRPYPLIVSERGMQLFLEDNEGRCRPSP